MKNTLLKSIGILLIVSFCFLIFSNVYKGSLPKIVEEINNSAIGAILTAFVTVLLLQGQTASEERRDKSIKVFEKKQDVFHSFLEELKKIVNDGQIKLASFGANADLSQNTDELKDLLFQLGYIQMHTSAENTNLVFTRVSKIIQVMNDFSSEESRKQEALPEFYASLSEELFGVVSILKSDLYGTAAEQIPRENIVRILKECDLFIDDAEFDQYEAQKYFWNELQKQLIARGHILDYCDLSNDVDEFYARSRNRHKFYGVKFPVYTTKNGSEIMFSMEIENTYYYGFPKNELNEKKGEIIAAIKETSPSFKNNQYWYGWKYPDRYNLDFWNLNSPEFERLKHPRKREQLIKDIAEELHNHISRFKSIAQSNDL